MFVVDDYKWLKSFLQMTGGIPKTSSYERIISLIDNDELNKILFGFMSSFYKFLKINLYFYPVKK